MPWPLMSSAVLMCLPSLRFHEAPFYARSRSPPGVAQDGKSAMSGRCLYFFPANDCIEAGTAQLVKYYTHGPRREAALGGGLRVVVGVNACLRQQSALKLPIGARGTFSDTTLPAFLSARALPQLHGLCCSKRAGRSLQSTFRR
jgi:hypothetical protein